MDAGVAGGATEKGRLRRKLLNAEQDIDGLSEQQVGNPMGGSVAAAANFQNLPGQDGYGRVGGAGGGAGYGPGGVGFGGAGAGGVGAGVGGVPGQFYQGGMSQSMQFSDGGYVNSQDSLGIGAPSSAPRMGSMTSTSGMSMNKFFRRNKNEGLGFDEENGVDIQDLTYGSNVSFDDISHIRDRGPYGLSSAKTLDTTPIIPTLGMGIGTASGGGKTVSNIQYRKQMNHQKKKALASTARAMSLAGSNPMNSGQPDGRAMSLNAFGNLPGQGPRTMSLNSNPAPVGGPRAMSLNNRMPMPPTGPRAMSMRTTGLAGPPMHMGNGPYMGMSQAGTRTGSLNNFSHQFHNNQAQYQMGGQQVGPQMGPQGGQQLGHPGPRPGQYFPGQNPATMARNGGGAPGVNSRFPQGQYNHPAALNKGQPMGYSGYQNNYAAAGGPPVIASNDSLNVLQEEEDEKTSIKQEAWDSSAQKPRINNDENDLDVTYKSDGHDSDQVLLSRKSTLKKSNSMKLRRINLFDSVLQEGSESRGGDDNKNEVSESPSYSKEEVDKISPSFNLNKSTNYRDSILHDEEDDRVRNREYNEKMKILGASANANQSNATSLNNVFVTATDLTTPPKAGGEKKISPLKTSVTRDAENHGADQLTERGSPNPPRSESTHTLPKQPSIHSLVANTAYDKFRASRQVSNDPEFNDMTNSFSNNSISEDYELDRSPFDTYKVQEQAQDSSQYSTDKSALTSKDNIDNLTPPNGNFSNGSAITNYTNVQDGKNAQENEVDISKKVEEEEEEKAPAPASEIYSAEKQSANDSFASDAPNGLLTEENSLASSGGKKESRPKSFSLTGKSKNLFKRLSRTSRKGTDEELAYEGAAISASRRSSNVLVAEKGHRSSLSGSSNDKPVKITKEDLGILKYNNDLLNELQIVTTELASSIKRDLSLENRLKNNSIATSPVEDYESLLLQKLKAIADLQEKLNKERSMRFICEEHVLLMESGTSPSPLKLNYEKNELYKQLIVKNDAINQLEDKLNEAAKSQNKEEDQNLLYKYNELLKENAHLKFQVIPELEKQVSEKSTSPSQGKLLRLIQGGEEDDYDDEEYNQSQDLIEINTLKTQRDELREVVTKLSSGYNYDLKQAQEKIKKLEQKLQQTSLINDKLTSRLESGQSSRTETFDKSGGNGAKLQGFTIVSPRKNLFDD